MTAFSSTDSLKCHLLETQIFKAEALTLRDIEGLCAPLFEEIGLETSIQDKLTEYVLLEDGYCIDAEQVLKTLGVISSAGYSDKTRRVLVRANVLPHDANDNNDINTNGSEDISTRIFQNSKCEIYHCDEVKSGKTYHTTKYMITKRGLCKVLQRAYNDDRFSEYFSLKLELSAIYSQYQSDHKARRMEVTHDNFRDEILTAMQMMGTKLDSQSADLQKANQKLDSASGKLDFANAQLKSERITNVQVIRRVNSMATEFWKMRSYADQKSLKSTKDPSNEDLCHGFAITTKKGRDRSTNAAMYHFGIIAGQRRYVEKTVESKKGNERRSVLMGFTYIANPIDYRNNVVTKVQERLNEAAEQANAEFSLMKTEANIAVQDRINALEHERQEADRQYSYNLRAWTNPESVKRELNAQIGARNQVLQERLKQDVAAHNAQQKLLPREERTSRNWQREWPSIREPKLVQDEEVYTALTLLQEPSLTDYISSKRLSDVTQEISRLKMEHAQPARQISAQDIPVKVTTLACVWKENKWFRREELQSIFHEVLSETQNMSADVDESIFEDIQKMDAEDDDLTSMMVPEDEVDRFCDVLDDAAVP
jgi:hypothetical protein